MMTLRSLLGAVACLAGILTACQRKVELPPNLFPESAAGGWRRVALREGPASESPDPVPRTAIERCLAASYDGPGKLEARVYVLSASAVAFELTERWRPSADTMFFDHGPFFV